jgi:hypothetical protein
LNIQRKDSLDIVPVIPAFWGGRDKRILVEG